LTVLKKADRYKTIQPLSDKKSADTIRRILSAGRMGVESITYDKKLYDKLNDVNSLINAHPQL